MEVTTTNLWSAVGILVLVEAMFVCLMLAPLELVRYIALQNAELLGAPLYPNILLFPPVLLFGYVAFVARVHLKSSRISAQYLLHIFGNTLRWQTFVLVVLSAPLYVFALSSYWLADTHGLTVSHWFMSRVVYLWTDTSERSLSCQSGRRGYYINFALTLRDGLTIDLALTQQQPVIDNLSTLLDLTKAARTTVSYDAACPRNIAKLLASVEPQAAPIAR